MATVRRCDRCKKDIKWDERKVTLTPKIVWTYAIFLEKFTKRSFEYDLCAECWGEFKGWMSKGETQTHAETPEAAE